jgi:hypothetical protein
MGKSEEAGNTGTLETACLPFVDYALLVKALIE